MDINTLDPRVPFWWSDPPDRVAHLVFLVCARVTCHTRGCRMGLTPGCLACLACQLGGGGLQGVIRGGLQLVAFWRGRYGAGQKWIGNSKNFLQICERAHEIFCVSARIVHFGKSESAEKIRTGLNSVSPFWSQKRPELIGAILHVFAHFFSHVFRLSKNAIFETWFFEFCVHFALYGIRLNIFFTKEPNKTEKTGYFWVSKWTILSSQNDLHFSCFFRQANSAAYLG